MFRTLLPVLGLVACLAAPAVAARPTPEAQLARALEGRVAGKPTRCITPYSTVSSEIIDRTAILYRIGGTVYVNTPRSGAESLRDDDILVTQVFGGQLCNIDTVHLIDRASHFPHGFVVLGDFVPYAKPRTRG